MKIACWSGPRNISTALMRSWSSRDDTTVIDEPFYSSYLISTKLKHPMYKEIIKRYPSKNDDIIKLLTSKNPNKSDIWYQKHMAHHILDFKNINFILSFENTFLIRNPKKVIFSYIKKNKLNDAQELGYDQQYRLLRFLQKNDKKFNVVDSDKLLNNPTLILKKWCATLNIKFDNRMLTWEKGIHKNDGIWAKHWYDSVANTTTFKNKPDQKKEILEKKYINIYNHCNKLYEKMLEFTL